MADLPALAVVILAAGKGTRMKSSTHKVLHPIGGRPMLLHLMGTLKPMAPARTVVVVGDKADQVTAALQGTGAVTAVQEPQLGTGHAVLQAHDALAGFDGDVLVLYGDVPLIPAEALVRLRHALHERDAAFAVLAFHAAAPGAYGRVIADEHGRILKMVEAKDATPEELRVTLCNSGVLAARAEDLWRLLRQVGNDNAAGEYYLPDVIMLAQAEGLASTVISTDETHVAGVNSRGELAVAEARFQQQRRAELMASGVTLVAPETVFLSHDTRIEADVTIEPYVVFGPGVSIAGGTIIRSHSHLEGAQVGAGCEVGPFARLRPGTILGAKARIGNFVETKKAVLGEGAKANHLTYLGDVTVGARANIGAGTITCNYDGFLKYQTVIGDGAFIGSNSALVAPVTIGAGAIVGAGSTITKDVPDDALALVRPPQEAKLGWASRFRATMATKKRS